jgi:Uma2 family endonuclease
MSVPLPAEMDKTAFLDWMQRQEEPHELVGGRVVKKARSSKAHAMIVGNLVALLHGQLDPRQWAVLMHFGLDAGPRTLRYPDVVVDRAGGNLADFTAAAPILLAEVLSPSTAQIDIGDKAAEYLQLPSLTAYLVFAQNAHVAYVWARETDAFPAAPTVVVGSDTTVRIAALNLNLPLVAVYAHVGIV